MQRAFSRRKLFRLVGAGLLTGSVGCNPNVANAVADAVIAVGGLTLTIPHPAGKVVGVVLVLSGSAAKIVIAALDGSRREETVQLNEDQKKALDYASTTGQKATVTQTDGSTSELLIENK
jgi:hypothetical protein